MPSMFVDKGERGCGGEKKKGRREHTLAKQRLHLFLSIFWEEKEKSSECVCVRERGLWDFADYFFLLLLFFST